MAKHELKTWPEPFKALMARTKHHEYRNNDRNFQVGDILVLREWDPQKKDYTGWSLEAEVTYMTVGPDWGVPQGYCIMSIVVEEEDDSWSK